MPYVALWRGGRSINTANVSKKVLGTYHMSAALNQLSSTSYTSSISGTAAGARPFSVAAHGARPPNVDAALSATCATAPALHGAHQRRDAHGGGGAAAGGLVSQSSPAAQRRQQSRSRRRRPETEPGVRRGARRVGGDGGGGAADGQPSLPSSSWSPRTPVKPPLPTTNTRAHLESEQRKEDEEAQSAVFDRMYHALMHEEATFVGELDRLLTSHELRRGDKAKALHTTWENEVYSPAQEEVQQAVAQRSIKQIESRNRALMQEYLDVSRKKDGGIFRDIIIESEYDPVSLREGNKIVYDARLRKDPAKLQVRMREEAERAQGSARRPEYSKSPTSGIPCLDVRFWDHMDATPYGRTSRLQQGTESAVYALNNRVTCDQFNVAFGRDAMLREIPRGKRCFHDGPPSAVRAVL